MNKKIILLLVLALMISGCALKQDVVFLEERIARLEKQNRNVGKKSSKQLTYEKKVRKDFASLRVKVDTLGDEFYQLKGRLEEIELILKKNDKNFDSIESSLARIGNTLAVANERLLEIEKSGVSAPGSAKKNGGKDNQTTKAIKDENALYDKAMKTMDKGQYVKARELFQKFIKEYPMSEKVDNAQFWIGDIYYRQKWYEKSILEYLKVIENYPEGNKVPAALLKQGFAFHKLKQKENAKLILQDLVRKYPGSAEATAAKKRLKALK